MKIIPREILPLYFSNYKFNCKGVIAIPKSSFISATNIIWEKKISDSIFSIAPLSLLRLIFEILTLFHGVSETPIDQIYKNSLCSDKYSSRNKSKFSNALFSQKKSTIWRIRYHKCTYLLFSSQNWFKNELKGWTKAQWHWNIFCRRVMAKNFKELSIGDWFFTEVENEIEKSFWTSKTTNRWSVFARLVLKNVWALREDIKIFATVILLLLPCSFGDIKQKSIVSHKKSREVLEQIKKFSLETQRWSGTLQHILTCQLRSKRKFTHQRSWETFEPWSDTWLTLSEISHQIIIKRFEKVEWDKYMSQPLILDKLICQSCLFRFSIFSPMFKHIKNNVKMKKKQH